MDCGEDSGKVYVMFKPEKHAAIILSYPNDTATCKLTRWLSNIGVHNVMSLNEKTKAEHTVYNAYIEMALASNFNHFIFCDNDLKPIQTQMRPWLEAEADVVCCEYPIGRTHEEGWASYNAFHTGIWRTSRKVLEAIEPPWFTLRYTDDKQVRLTGCICQTFRDRVLKARFSIAHVGYADHEVKKK